MIYEFSQPANNRSFPVWASDETPTLPFPVIAALGETLVH